MNPIPHCSAFISFCTYIWKKINFNRQICVSTFPWIRIPFQYINRKRSYRIEISQLAGFYVMATLAINQLKINQAMKLVTIDQLL